MMKWLFGMGDEGTQDEDSGCEPFPRTCEVCGWNGDPEQILTGGKPNDMDKQVGVRKAPKGRLVSTVWSPQPGCKSCELRLALAEHCCHQPDDVRFFYPHGHGGSAHQTAELRMQTSHRMDFHNHILSLFVPMESRKDLASIPRKALLPAYTASQSYTEEISRMVKECTETHTQCVMPSPNFHPTRLIHVNPSDNEMDAVTLVETANWAHSAQYIALSYCWGGIEPLCKTTVSSLKERTQCIMWDTLPRTIQDAVTFARWFGIDYLWVDSICIVQDDRDDWEREAIRMFEVYQNAFLTLAALHGKDSLAGLFTNLDANYQFKALEIEHDGEKYEIYCRKLHNGACSIHDMGESPHSQFVPLKQRGWTLQERLISPRTIFFGHHGLTWECRTSADCECLRVHSMNHGEPKAPTLKQRFLSQDDPSFRLGNDGWYNIVSNYTTCSLSKVSDRLIAIGAIAKHYSLSRPGDTYLAGLWRSTFLDDMIWNCSGEPTFGKPGRTIKDHLIRAETLPREWVAPSWSWASVNTHVTFCSRGQPDTTVSQPLLEILDVQVKYRNSEPFGVALSAYARLRGYVLSCSVGPIWRMTDRGIRVECFQHTYDWRVDLDPRPYDTWRDMCFEKDDDDDSGQYLFKDLHLMVLAESNPSARWTAALLCRTEIDQEEHGGHVFSRIGIVELPSWELLPRLQKLEKREVILV
ncbi:MAG: hypothetical protein Q9227_001845 [Pyrenula ochraceoflavens]